MLLGGCAVDNAACRYSRQPNRSVRIVPADTTQSFTDVMVPLLDTVQPTPVNIRVGDMLFSNGSLRLNV